MPKECRFNTQTLKSWDEIYNHRYEEWLYRGQRIATRPLMTSLERMCLRLEGNLKNAPKIEQKLIREFRRRYYQYRSNIRDEEDLLEWLSIMQHFGAPTRLLDFTYSIFVAAYFALQSVPQHRPSREKKEHASVWAINAKWALEESSKLFPDKKVIFNPMDEKSLEDFKDAFFSKEPKMFACNVNPFRLNERLTLQRGVFMCPGNVARSFEENLLSLQGATSSSNVKKLVIPESLREIAMKELRDMNIDYATLFPGLDGFATSLQFSIPKVWEDVSIHKKS